MANNGDPGSVPKTAETENAESLTIQQVAAYLNYSRQWVEEAVLDGRIKATRVGGQYRISREELDRVQKDGLKKRPNDKATLLTVRQVAAMLNYSRGWVEEAVLDKRIKATRVGGQYRISLDEVERVKSEGVAPGSGKKKKIPSEQPAKVEVAIAPPALPVPAAPPTPAAVPVKPREVKPAPAQSSPQPAAPPAPPAAPEKKKDGGILSFLQW